MSSRFLFSKHEIIISNFSLCSWIPNKNLKFLFLLSKFEIRILNFSFYSRIYFFDSRQCLAWHDMRSFKASVDELADEWYVVWILCGGLSAWASFLTFYCSPRSARGRPDPPDKETGICFPPGICATDKRRQTEICAIVQLCNADSGQQRPGLLFSLSLIAFENLALLQLTQ